MSRTATGRQRAGAGPGGPRVVTLARLDLRADRSGTASLAVLVLITTVLAAAVPVVFTRSADAALPAMMAAAPALQRDLAFTLEDRIDGTSGDPLSDVLAAGEELRQALPPSVAALVDHGVVAADTVALEASEKQAENFTARLRLRAQPNVEQRLRYVSGRAPVAGSVGQPIRDRPLDEHRGARQERPRRRLRPRPGVRRVRAGPGGGHLRGHRSQRRRLGRPGTARADRHQRR